MSLYFKNGIGIVDYNLYINTISLNQEQTITDYLDIFIIDEENGQIKVNKTPTTNIESKKKEKIIAQKTKVRSKKMNRDDYNE